MCRCRQLDIFSTVYAIGDELIHRWSGSRILGAGNDQNRYINRFDCIALVHGFDGGTAAGKTVNRGGVDHVTNFCDFARMAVMISGREPTRQSAFGDIFHATRAGHVDALLP